MLYSTLLNIPSINSAVLSLAKKLMIDQAKSKFIFLLTVLTVSIVGCSKQAPDITSIEQSDEDFQVHYTLPAEWETFEVVDNQYGGKDISIVTSLGTFITIYAYPVTNTPAHASIEYFIKRYLVASVPEGEARDVVKIDSGEVDRRNLTGQYFHAKAPAPFNADYVVEVFEFQTEVKQFYLVLNNTSELLPELNPAIDLFISTIE